MKKYFITASETTSYEATIEAKDKETAEGLFIEYVENCEPSDVSGFQIDEIKEEV